jgi:outer membrane receptor protein involved in Fe transport
MNTHYPAGLKFVAPMFAMLLAEPLCAQAVREPAADASLLARYDANQNGRLDPEELARMTESERRAFNAVAAGPASAALSDEVVTMSPFEVVTTSNTGYVATNAMSGARLATSLLDLPSSISVVTKQQMEDFAMVDINDIFAHEANTEGTETYTAYSINANGQMQDNIMASPHTSNRIRGLSTANIAIDNFPTSKRVPVDPIDIEAVEISRGPNSSIFGLGSGGGTVNMVSASAHLNAPRTVVTGRLDSYDGWRYSLDVNRDLIKDKLAARISGVHMNESWPQKPSSFKTKRYNLMLRAEPFKRTLLKGSFQYYEGEGTRATGVTPRDGVTPWIEAGSPTWHPLNRAYTINGVATPYLGSAEPPGFMRMSLQNPVLYIGPNGIDYGIIARMPGAAARDGRTVDWFGFPVHGPADFNGVERLMASTTEGAQRGPLFGAARGISDINLYNWEDINMASANYLKDTIKTLTLSIEQTLLNNGPHRAALQVAWQHEDADQLNKNSVGSISQVGNSFTVHMDANEVQLDGSPNPYFGQTYIGIPEPRFVQDNLVRDHVRAQAAYSLDMRREDGWKRWLGRQQLLGYWEERRVERERYFYRYSIISDHPVYSPAGLSKGNNTPPRATFANRPYALWYLGGPVVQRAPAPWGFQDYPFTWYNGHTGDWVTDTVTFGPAAILDGTGGTTNLVRTSGLILHSSLLDDRIVVTAGLREDKDFSKNYRGTTLLPNGYEFDYDKFYWEDEWESREGKTKSYGLVFRPFRGWSAIERSNGFAQRLLRGLQLHYNHSDSFVPAVPAVNLNLEQLDNPTAIQEEYGFAFHLLQGKAVFRANFYTHDELNSRAATGTFISRVMRLDFHPFRSQDSTFSLNRVASEWLRAVHPDWSEQQIHNEVWNNIMGINEDVYHFLQDNNISDTSHAIGKGQEYELFLHPTNHWRFKMNVTRQETMLKDISRAINDWIDRRMPIWQNTIDPRNGVAFYDNPYPGNSQRPRVFLLNNVLAGLELAQAAEGTPNPQTRKYRVNMATSYDLAGISDNRHLRRTTLGTSVRWESKGAIGNYGIPVNGDITQARAYDPSRPIWDDSHTYVDAFISYRTPLFNDKVRARFQLNVKNIQESGRIQAIGAYPDGDPHTFRIVNPRKFIFTTSFAF